MRFQGSLDTHLCLLCPREARLGCVTSSTAGSLIRGITSVEDRVAAVTIACLSCSNENGPRLGTQCWLSIARGDTGNHDVKRVCDARQADTRRHPFQ